MKKLFTLTLCILLAVSMLAFVGCSKDNASTDSTPEAPATLKFGAGVYVSAPTATDATADKEGSGKVDATVAAITVDADGKVVAASSDCVEVSFTFNAEGVATLDTTKAIKTKKEQGKDYGMVAYGGSAKEWFEQAAAFDAACVGKTASEIAGLVGSDGKGVDSLQSAGCTIYVTGFVKAASKI